ncbi:MAG: hypothetical protein IIY12_00215 [Clostridia bacterium]|nr:hypothetical protein [Clostridia bacterium]
MISCTEFIPAYSELFSFLDRNYGRDEVDRFWSYLFAPDGSGIALINFLNKEGIKGCYSYWNISLNEESADFSMYLNEKDGWFKMDMHRCPSKGRLLELKEKTGIEPYRDYCLHCDHYRESVEKIGLEYVYDFSGTDKASCSILVYDPKKFPKKMIVDENTVQTHRNAADNEYFHKDFHNCTNTGVQYLAEKHGKEALLQYLHGTVTKLYANALEDIKKNGISAIQAALEERYHNDKCDDVLTVTEENGKTLFHIAYCPAVKHFNETGRKVSEYFPLVTQTMVEIFGKQAGLSVSLESHDPATGKATYSFTKA